MPSTPTISSATCDGRPETHATSAYRPARRRSSVRVGSGTRASPGRGTIGASVPSTSSSSAARSGRSGGRRRRRWGRASAAPEQPRALDCLRMPPGGPRGQAPRLMGVVLLAITLGFLAGILAGLFGVGGGILFVPTLTLGLGLTQIHAEATSLLAVLPTVAAGAWRQQRYGNVRWRAAPVLGIAAIGGVEAGVQTAAPPP